MNSSSAPDNGSPVFQDYAEAQATATARALVARAAKPALTELEALRVALNVRCESLTSTLAGIGNIDPAPIHELVERLAHAAGEEASAAAHAARTLALDEADARLKQDRAEAQTTLDAVRAEAQQQLDAARADAAEERNANQIERRALADALATATLQADALRTERDAQRDTLRVAREQADEVRADRDVQLEALRAAQAQAEAIRADRDAQLEALGASQAQLEALRTERDAQITALLADRDAQLGALRADRDTRLEALRADRDAQVEALRFANERADAARADRDAQLTAAEAAKEEARTVLAEQDFLLEAARISNARHAKLLEQAQARVDAAQAQLAAARTDAEQRIAAGAREIEALHLELEGVRASAQAASAETIAPAAGAAMAAEPTARAEVLRSEPELEAAPSAIVTLPRPAPIAAPVVADPVLAMYQAIGGAADLSQVLDALIDGVGALFPRAALFVVKTRSKRLQGWRSVGFTGVATITREFEFPLSTDSALTRAVTASRTIFTGDGQPAAQPAEAWTVTFPVTTGGRVVAVVHADGGARNGEATPAFERDTALDLGHTLVRMASERIGALTMSARAAFGSVINGAPAGAAPANRTPADAASVNGTPVNGTYAGGARAGTPVNGAHVDGSRQPAAPARLEDAERFASQLVSEINRYNLMPTDSAPADHALQERLTGQIEGAGTLAPAPAPAAAGNALSLLDEALGKMLEKGAADAAPVAIQPVRGM